jgi:hypothetical protein
MAYAVITNKSNGLSKEICLDDKSDEYLNRLFYFYKNRCDRFEIHKKGL